MKHATSFPRTTAAKAVKTLLRKGYHIDSYAGRVYNPKGYEVGSATYEPRVTVHLAEGKKYSLRINKIVAFDIYGPVALHRGVQIRHKNGNRFDNRGENLLMVQTKDARLPKAA